MFDRISRRRPLWLAVTIAYPIAGVVGFAVGGPVDGPTGALAALAAGAVLGVAQVLALGAREARGAGVWIGATALGLAIGTVVGVALRLPLPLTGLVAGALMGAGQAVAARAADLTDIGWTVVMALPGRSAGR